MELMTRYCPRCDAEVEDAGGYCLLGHPLRLASEMPSLADLRSENRPLRDLSAEDVQVRELRAQVDDAFVGLPSAAEAALADVESRGLVPTAAPAPATVALAPPPQPPPGPASEGSVSRTRPIEPAQDAHSVWNALGTMEPGRLAADPIAAFAPAMRVDWGPRRRFSERLGRRLKGRA